jgi:hypothetical protein
MTKGAVNMGILPKLVNEILGHFTHDFPTKPMVKSMVVFVESLNISDIHEKFAENVSFATESRVNHITQNAKTIVELRIRVFVKFTGKGNL